ncbi:islet cell autoantigen 1-like protein isoform X1 [Neodiprion pinetum]|uniref:Islet cell autoantigen 1-like protein isoform X1 n=1 Tax=Neodiprion lecontei TaxID=441921 RepID=A0ABM3GI30_NEOLC|nr:islet cell autoantigen 1-like protein isoform X1 [Neodiprion pinetum]XP_046599923.1 islet cell autoantigen 1-like protein isoform X1 [Neodiprion lecontei]XP_046624869.1 islet cell autoantigen 1-like protein isoform X1 [Neodiprion virginianus]
MNAYDRGTSGMSGSAFDRWVQKADLPDDSAITKMQHQYWVTKQALSQKLGKKEDECIVASDAELDSKLELFRSIQESCLHLQRIIDKYQERLCNLAQEENAMGRFLKEAGKQDKTRAGKMMSAVGKSLSYSGQQRLALRAPLVRLYQEVETFRQRAIEDTLQNVQSMEKARTEYRAALSWMKNVSQELDPDTFKQLERFRKVQTRVRRGKSAFDHLALDCLQKVDLLAAARCNMFSHALVLYQSTLLNFTKKSAQAYATIANSFKGYQQYDFMVVKELAETSIKLAQKTGGNEDLDDKDKLLFFESDYHDNVEEAQEVKATDEKKTEAGNIEKDNDEKLLDIGDDSHIPDNTELSLSQLNLNTDDENRDKGLQSFLNSTEDKELADFFNNIDPQTKKLNEEKSAKKIDQVKLDESLTQLDLAMDSFTGTGVGFDFTNSPLFNPQQQQPQAPLDLLTSESVALFEEILNTTPTTSANDWEMMSGDTFLPPGILKQSLGAATLGTNQKDPVSASNDNKQNKSKSNKTGNSWLDLFAELDPLANNPMDSLISDRNAPA